jgi:hypothetical protein
MPGKVNEDLWDKAKAKVTEEYGTEEKIGNEKFYKLTSTIYKDMGGEFHKSAFEIVSALSKAAEEQPAKEPDRLSAALAAMGRIEKHEEEKDVTSVSA